VGTPGPTGEERGKPVRSGNDEPVVETGAGAVAPLLTDRKPVGKGNMQGGAAFYSCAHGEMLMGRLEHGV
jgi:hypothetical protein